MRELLERWAARQPEWCRFAVGHNDLVFVGPTNGVLGETVTLLRLTELHRQSAALILAAVIEAIEARGWEWTIWSGGAEREATVHIQDDDPKQPRRNHGTGLTTAQPAAALLGAYLAALEAEADQ